MNTVQKIEIKNLAAFVMSFDVTDGASSTPSTGNYPVSVSRSIDLVFSKFAEGAEVWAKVSVVLGKEKDSEKLIFGMNGKTAVYEVKGTIFGYSINFVKIEEPTGSRPAGFPANIAVAEEQFINWDQTINVPAIWTCMPRSGADVATACNWAAQNGYTVRPRGIMHSWSPMSVTPGLPTYDKMLLIDTTVCLNDITFIPASGSNSPAVKTGTGATMGQLMEFMEKAPGGKGSATGYSFPHIPAPDHLTVGGVIAINAHGTAVPNAHDDFNTTYGSMSNRILSLTAVVTDPASATPDTYQLKTFERGDKETTAFMTQLGRAVITEVTLQVIDNYNMRCLSITDVDKSVLFQPQTGGALPAGSCGDYLLQSGRIEVIWFPFSTYPWLKVWTAAAEKPATSREVDGPNNYAFSDNLPLVVTSMIDKILNGVPELTVAFGSLMQDTTIAGLNGLNVLGHEIIPQSRDIWGASKNTLFYVKDTTLRVTANGYAVLMNKGGVQQSIADFTTKFENMLNDYRSKKKFPINGPVEIRVTGLDNGDHMPSITGGPSGRPVISGLATDDETVKNDWDVAVWFDVLTLPGTPYSDEFYAELEDWMLEHFKSPAARVVPEWSKGWAYTTSAPWTKASFISHIKECFTTSRAADDNWAWEVATMAKYDKHNLYQSKLIDTLFS